VDIKLEKKLRKLSLGAVALLAGTLTACTTTIQTRTTGETLAIDKTKSEVFDIARRAALEAGLTITSVDRDGGLIMATRGSNAFLTYQNPVMNISVDEYPNGTSLFISSTVGGQMVDYGTTASTIQDFCSAINRRLPTSKCSINR